MQTFEIKRQETIDGERYLVRFTDDNFTIGNQPHQATFYALRSESLYELQHKLSQFIINELENK